MRSSQERKKKYQDRSCQLDFKCHVILDLSYPRGQVREGVSNFTCIIFVLLPYVIKGIWFLLCTLQH